MTTMEDSEGKDTYVTQLKEVFDSCDATGTGSLNEEELRILCERLHLIDHANILIHHLLKSEVEVKFEDFKECFVAVLTQVIPSEEDATETENNEATDREVSPKFILGRKKYGRRSRPASIADEDISVMSPVLSPQSSFDQASDEMAVKIPSVENAPGKRPMSPNASQQPPSKSGRMTDEKMIISTDTSNSVQQGSNCDADVNQSFDNSPVQYLQETWKKLNIGQNGYLNVEELALVCEHIGMDMREEVISQLFEKLDCDQDGQISFDEFLQGLFQHGEPEPQNCESPEVESPSKSMYNEGSRDDHQITNSSVSGIFSCIDPENNGYADASAILELWESLELPCSPQLLEELGFNTNLKINLSDLTTVLEEVLCNVLKRPILHLAFVTYQNELQYLRQTTEQMHRERTKLRVSVEEANTRAALLAQEVDDNHARLESSLHNKLLLMEKKYQEQARVLAEELKQERDSISLQTMRLKQQMLRETMVLREEESNLKARLHLLQQENIRLEQELHETSEKCLEAQKLNEVLQKELLVMPDLKQRLTDLESHANDLQEQSYQNLLQGLEKYKKLSQELQDKIDELTLEIENMQQNCASEATPSKEVNRTHSWLSDYKKTLVSGHKRRGSESSSEENSDEESCTIGKLRKTFLSNGFQIHEVDSPTLQAESKKNAVKNPQPMIVDILVKDMMRDQACLMRKLQIAEENRLKMEKAFKQSENKNKVLSGLVRSLSEAVSA